MKAAATHAVATLAAAVLLGGGAGCQLDATGLGPLPSVDASGGDGRGDAPADGRANDGPPDGVNGGGDSGLADVPASDLPLDRGKDTMVSAAGCSDGTREGFIEVTKFPSIAACSGGWQLPGVIDTTMPACGRNAGNDSSNDNGKGCNVADLCAVGWHVCRDQSDVYLSLPFGETCASAVSGPSQMFITRKATPTFSSDCRMSGTDNLYGCGNIGLPPISTFCSPLNRTFTTDDCGMFGPWECGGFTDCLDEATVVVKPGPDGGGVLCCHD